MRTHGELSIDPGLLEGAPEAELEIAIPYTWPEETRATLDRAAALATGLNARILLVAIQPVPYPSTFGCPASTHAFLVARLLELCDACPLPVTARIVQARSREEGFRFSLKPGSMALVGTRKRWWRTREERLARRLAAAGHRVVLFYVR